MPDKAKMGWVGNMERQDPAMILSKSPFRILLAEDDPMQQLYCEQMLKVIFGDKLHLDWEAKCSPAIERLNSGEYDVCLLDYMVEDGTAKDILSHINFSIVNTPVIIVSAFDDKDFTLEALRHGADDYVIKGSFSSAQLELAIRYAIYRKHKELVLRQRAFYDPLTGLANRHLFLDRLGEVHRFSQRYQEQYGLLVIDLDKLKPINDKLGHHVGDRYIVAAAQALTSCVRNSDTVARIGGDEFVVLLKNIRDKESTIVVCAKICAAFAALMPEPGADTQPSCSIGVAVYPEDSKQDEELMRCADEAMYKAKRAGGSGFCLA